MTTNAYRPYEPLHAPKAFAEAVWIVDGPEIGMDYLGLTLPFPTRMTVVRLPSGALWIHSPIAWSDGLAAALSGLGPVRHLVAPNTLHYWFLPEWQERFPDARSYGAPGLARRAKRPLVLDESLGDAPPAAWEGAFDQCVVPGRLLTEVDFLHRASRTLILTDLIENFEPRRVRSPVLRWLMRLAGAADPDGKAPIDMQLSFIGHRRAVRAAVQRMLAWAPERIVLAHGRCYEANGTDELRRAFRWIL
ncbi:DUF4336 domain-containing protein [Methylobacterium sp. NEAU 140]|uniref:DUF4336 domain-containing protein n=1 Tax=Methylobacterium sp. NEAU 140 TaxID=3064945 RepID=UPI0027322D8F|nr:DUF4336 domain-containing protein [Methylobacterium sp. NEAU 140]MDP4026522.1 DUF4336 domain-containing protein [Methylobacterium sp. NEAU 140]